MFPSSDFAGRPGTSRLRVPSFDPAGHSTPGLGLFILNCFGVQASRPWAADGFIVMPSGRVTLAVLSCEESMPSGLWSCGRRSSVVMPSGRSDARFSRSRRHGERWREGQEAAVFGSDGGRIGGLSPGGPSLGVSVSVVVVCGPVPVHEVGLVRKPPLPNSPSPMPMLPLKISRELISGSAGETLISK